jgi:eukaryotic-like serine/threonine-protein kinase
MNCPLRRSIAALLIFFVLGLFSFGEVTAQTPPSPHLLWNYALTDGATYGLGMSGDGSELIAAIGFGFDPGGQIVSLDPATGAVRWLVETDEAPSADPIVIDGVVYAGIGSLVGGGAAVYALDAGSGAVLWETDIERGDLPATPIDAVTLSNGTLYVNRGDATLLALDAATGELKWEFDMQKPSRGAPFVEGDTVYVSTGFDGGRIFALDAATAEVRWSVEDRENPVTGPVLANGLLYVPYTSGDMVAYDPATGDERWRTMAGLRDEEGDMNPRPGLPMVAEGVLYTSSNGFAGANTVALDAATGEELWSVPTGDFSAGAPLLFEGVLLVGSDTGDLLALDPATGAELWRIAIPDAIDNDLDQASPPLAVGERIYVRDRAGGVVAIGLSR